jgi:hypothetical protein
VACKHVATSTAKQRTVQWPLIRNGSTNKHVSTAKEKYKNNERDVLYEVRAEIL